MTRLIQNKTLKNFIAVFSLLLGLNLEAIVVIFGSWHLSSVFEKNGLLTKQFSITICIGLGLLFILVSWWLLIVLALKNKKSRPD